MPSAIVACTRLRWTSSHRLKYVAHDAAAQKHILQGLDAAAPAASVPLAVRCAAARKTAHKPSNQAVLPGKSGPSAFENLHLLQGVARQQENYLSLLLLPVGWQMHMQGGLGHRNLEP